MNYEELDDVTRKWMLEEFNNEQSQKEHFQSKSLNQTGLSTFPDIMRKAIQTGNIESLAKDLSDPSFWNTSKPRRTKNGTTLIPINPQTESKMLAHSEFNTMYTRGFARRLKEEGEENCEIYRADKAVQPKCECTKLEGTIQPVQKIYDGHRAKYFPKDNFGAFSIPSIVYCHHTIRRVKKKN